MSFTGKDRVIFVTEEDHNGPAEVSLPEDDEAPGKRLSADLTKFYLEL